MIGGNWKQVDAVEEGSRRRPPAGGYVARIKTVENVPQREYLRVEYDIAEGEWMGYFADLYERAHFWGGTFYRSYKEKARGLFKGFIVAVEESNNVSIITEDGSIDELKLVGNEVGVVLGEEEYIGNDGSLKTHLKVVKTLKTERIRKGDFTVPELKKLEGQTAPAAQNDVIDTTQAAPQGFDELTEELPF